MSGLLQRVLRGRTAKPIPYEESKRLSTSSDPAQRRRVAGHEATRPELLFVLAADADPGVRAAVATNDATPVQADLVLARDGHGAVREDLARKIARLAPGLTAHEQDRLRRMTYEVLEILVKDQEALVRRILADALKDVADAPPDIIRQLAFDSEITVAAPVLQFSPVLTDADLLAIIARDPIAGALTAVAQRDGLAETVGTAIGASGDVDAIAALLANPSAQIREETLDRLVDLAPGVTPWHAPLVRRPRLPAGAAERLARFVAGHLLAVLRERRDFDPETKRAIGEIVMSRIGEAEPAAPAAPDPATAALARARSLQARGELDDDVVDAAIDDDDRPFIRAALAVLTTLTPENIDRILATPSAKGIVSLAWRAGLSPHIALRLQVAIAHLPPQTLIKPLPSGTYALKPEAMRWQLDFLTAMANSAG